MDHFKLFCETVQLVYGIKLTEMVCTCESDVSITLYCCIHIPMILQIDSSDIQILVIYRVATNLENMENLEDSGNLKNC